MTQRDESDSGPDLAGAAEAAAGALDAFEDRELYDTALAFQRAARDYMRAFAHAAPALTAGQILSSALGVVVTAAGIK